jgi:hypothetical protein
MKNDIPLKETIVVLITHPELASADTVPSV